MRAFLQKRGAGFTLIEMLVVIVIIVILVIATTMGYFQYRASMTVSLAIDGVQSMVREAQQRVSVGAKDGALLCYGLGFELNEPLMFVRMPYDVAKKTCDFSKASYEENTALYSSVVASVLHNVKSARILATPPRGELFIFMNNGTPLLFNDLALSLQFGDRVSSAHALSISLPYGNVTRL